MIKRGYGNSDSTKLHNWDENVLDFSLLRFRLFPALYTVLSFRTVVHIQFSPRCYVHSTLPWAIAPSFLRSPNDLAKWNTFLVLLLYREVQFV